VATTVSSTRIDLVWADNSSSEQGFKVERSTDGVTFAQIGTMASNNTFASDMAVTAGHSYYYRVRAYNTSGDSDYSMVGRATTASGPAPSLPAAPSALTATAASSSQINLAWTDNANNETGFAIERSTDNATFTQIATVGVNVTTYANTGLNAGTTYHYRVHAYNSVGNSAFANTASATTPGATSGGTRTFSNSSALTLRDHATANPYPSRIQVSGMSGAVAKVTVKLTGLSHKNPDDLDVLLVGPGGQKVVLMSDAGGSEDLERVTITLDNAAFAALPDYRRLRSGTYRPANYSGSDAFPAPAPAGPYGATLAAFNQTNPNGTWLLHIVDDHSDSSGSLGYGWSLTITTTAP
jgi:subtilisin-like proprotein convertase family protein